jgi:hypothetical protein
VMLLGLEGRSGRLREMNVTLDFGRWREVGHSGSDDFFALY